MSKADHATVELAHDDAARAAAVPLAHDGRTVAAWTGSAIAGVGFVVAGIGFLIGLSVPVISAGLGIVLVGAIVGGILHKLGYGVREH